MGSGRHKEYTELHEDQPKFECRDVTENFLCLLKESIEKGLQVC